MQSIKLNCNGCINITDFNEMCRVFIKILRIYSVDKRDLKDAKSKQSASKPPKEESESDDDEPLFTRTEVPASNNGDSSSSESDDDNPYRRSKRPQVSSVKPEKETVSEKSEASLPEESKEPKKSDESLKEGSSSNEYTENYKIDRDQMEELVKTKALFYDRVGVKKILDKGKEKVLRDDGPAEICNAKAFQPIFITPSYKKRNDHLKPRLYKSPKTGKKYYYICPTWWCNRCYKGFHQEDENKPLEKCPTCGKSDKLILACGGKNKMFNKWPMFRANAIPCCLKKPEFDEKNIRHYYNVNQEIPELTTKKELRHLKDLEKEKFFDKEESEKPTTATKVFENIQKWSITGILEFQRLAFLSEKDANILFQSNNIVMDYPQKMPKNKQLFLRYGLYQKESPKNLLQSIALGLNQQHQKIDLMENIRNILTIEIFCQLNDGNLISLFSPKSPPSKINEKIFAKYFENII